MKRTDATSAPPSPAPPANTTICPDCDTPTSSPRHVCAPKAVAS